MAILLLIGSKEEKKKGEVILDYNKSINYLS